MPPRIPASFSRRLAVRPMRACTTPQFSTSQQRFASNDDKKGAVGRMQEKAADTPHGANESQLGHVTEEQAAMDKIMGDVPPQTEEQSTPIQEILSRDKEAQKNAPQVLKKDIKQSTGAGGQKRSFSTSARRCQTEVYGSSTGDALPESMLVSSSANPATFEETRAVGLQYPDAGPGHKFPLPNTEQWQITDHLRRRYDPVVDQFTKMIMRDGKLAKAQKNMNLILTALRTAPLPPASNTTRPLLTDTSIATSRITSPAIPRPYLPLAPIAYLTTVIDSVSPLLKITQQAGVLGGGANLPIPVPLRVKQRRRQAIKWILDAAAKKGGIGAFWERIVRELVNVAQGSSGVWDRRATVHRMATSARSNVRDMGTGKKQVKRARLPQT